MSESAINIAIFGAAGRMGRQLLQAVDERRQSQQDVHLCAAIEMPGTPAVGLDAQLLCPGLASGSVEVVESLASVVSGLDVLIDFTRPDASIAQLPLLIEHGKALVLGTTGLTDEQKATLREASREIPVVHASNYSAGVTVALGLLTLAASALGDDYDVEIIEAHHRHKVDAPSGTALTMGETVAAALGRDLSSCAIYGREGQTGARDRHTIGFETIRGGDIIGDHTVLFAGEGERLEITHKASDRMTFARGAIRAAHWVKGQSPGLYDMTHVVGLNSL